ncbi:hypothetical protein RhiirA4_459738 [Rhizophagus irregularis]|uniref:Uncharacterized protein n=1 Tax=Rhizophagus irregularis TaxID=588596 RepID=A0A2I1GF28_9GLOM|nr:hypothetical protein RhiirA4_459738 [Rhizophagus irregularis]
MGENHFTEDMIDLIQKCDNKCADCNTYAKVKVRVRLVKQLRVKNILEENNIPYEVYDSIVSDQGCSKKCLDFVIDTYKVVLEVDEYQYKKGEYNYEAKRMWNIAQA